MAFIRSRKGDSVFTIFRNGNFIRNIYKQNILDLQHISTNRMIADVIEDDK